MAHHIIERNRFYSLTPFAARESILSISSWDYSVAFVNFEHLQEILTQLGRQEIAVLNSSVFSATNLSEISKLVLENKTQLRAQVSGGAELERYQQHVSQWLQSGVGIDILVDRPMSADLKQRIDELGFQALVRVCVVANRYFSLPETLLTLPKNLVERTYLLYLPPTTNDSCYFSADEVVASLAEIQNLGISKMLVYANIVESHPAIEEKEFFLSLDCECYYSKVDRMQGMRQLRNTLHWMLKRRAVVLMDLLYFFLVFLKKPSLKSLLKIGKVMVWAAWGQIRQFGFWIFIIFRYRFLGFANRVWPYVLYPFLKVYWFLSYQIENRILPWLNKGKE